MKIALVHDWLTGMRGGEKVYEFLCRLYPQADRYALVHQPGAVSSVIEGPGVRTSWLQHLPGGRRFYRYYLPILPMLAETLDLEAYDLVISSSSCAAKGVLTRPDALHVSYVHSPMRYAWDLSHHYFPTSNPVHRWVTPFLLAALRMWDVTSAQRVDRFIANSSFVAQRIRKYYRRSATVIHPPVDTSRFAGASERGDAYLAVGALVANKGVDLLVEAFNRTRRPLRIVGTGPLERRLRRAARDNVTFLGWLSDEELVREYRSCRAFVHGAVEDFGIAPVEAAAAGKAVIALGRGGVLDSVVPRGGAAAPTGVLFAERSADALCAALAEYEAHEDEFEPAALRAWAARFDEEVTREALLAFVDQAWRAHRGGDPELPSEVAVRAREARVAR
ncbi:MAG: glycosyltransferase [Planctomycetes bacterium]|nr:glycosyltransferase [Planctomycetota bacterium]